MTTNWCATTPLPIDLTHTGFRSSKRVIRITPIGGCVIHVVQWFNRNHNSICQNIWIRTCDLWKSQGGTEIMQLCVKDNLVNVGCCRMVLLLTLAHLHRFCAGFRIPLASVTFTLFLRIWIKTLWADVSQYTTSIIWIGEDVFAPSDIQIIVRALR